MRMLHVTIQTNHFEEEIKFYEEVVQLKMDRDMRPMGRQMVFLNDEPGATCIEIIENAEADNAGNAFLSVGFKSEDVEAMREKLVAAGYECTPMVSPNPKTKFFHTKDPAGVRVQFM